MSILSLVTYAIGPSIAKAILKLWLKDQGILPDVLPDLLDLLKSTAEGSRDARNAAKRIEALGIQIVEQMQPVFDDARLDAEGRAVAARELATTLAEARIRPRLLAQCNFDPELLVRNLEAIRPDAVKLLSASESALYNRLLGEAASAITDIASDMRGFDTAVAAASLQDNEKILAMLTELRQRPAQSDQEFENKYRALVQQRLDKFEPFGLPKMDATTRVQSLSRVYITLQYEHVHFLVTNSRVGASLRTARHSEQLPLFEEDGDAPLTRRVVSVRTAETTLRKGDIDQLLAFTRRAVIRGDAGSGKSTLLQWLAVRAADQSFIGPLAGWNNTIPFFIRLRERVDRTFPAPEEFVALLEKTIAGAMPQGWAHRQLETGRALVLVDGVDELPQAKREELLQSLSGLITAYPLARYIVTSRPAALKEDDWPAWSEWTSSERFTDATLQPLTPDQVNILIRQWHEALEEKITDADERAEIRQLPSTLHRTLRLRPALRRLTTNPLLCSMICALHRDSRENLPSERLKLYEQCAEMLLSKRDEGRKVQLGPEYAKINPSQQRALVENFAYWMMRNNYSDVSLEDADAQFQAKLPTLATPDATGVSVRRYLVERTSLLREPVDGRIDFTHRTFEEFFAAHQALKENDLGLLVNKATDDQWRELIILAAGIARPKEADRFLRNLIKRAKTLKRQTLHHRVLLLAVACLETCVELTPVTREYIIEQASSLFPPKDDDEARLVSAAGDPAVPLLVYNPQHIAAESIACIRALAQIGTSKAMHSIAAYMDAPALEVREAIVEVWDFFDRAEYARLVLSKSDTLILRQLTTWDGFEQFHILKALAILVQAEDIDTLPPVELNSLNTLSIGLPSISNFKISPRLRSRSRLTRRNDRLRTKSSIPAFIVKLPSLNQLFINILGISDLSPLASLSNLTALSIQSTELSDLSPLAGLSNLTTLSIQSTELSDLSPLAGLSNLTNLSIESNALSDLSPLAGLSNLTNLSIESNALSDLSPLSGLSNLSQLTIQCPNLSDLSPLSGLSNLTDLSIESNALSDLSPLSGLSNLSQLTIQCNDINNTAPLAVLTDLAPLAGLTSLSQLNIQGSAIKDLSALARLTSLTQINIRSQYLTNIMSLASLINLKELLLFSTVLSDIAPLSNLINLTELSLFSDVIKDLSPLSSLINLKHLSFYSYVASDLTPLMSLVNLEELEIEGYKDEKRKNSIDLLISSSPNLKVRRFEVVRGRSRILRITKN